MHSTLTSSILLLSAVTSVSTQSSRYYVVPSAPLKCDQFLRDYNKTTFNDPEAVRLFLPYYATSFGVDYATKVGKETCRELWPSGNVPNGVKEVSTFYELNATHVQALACPERKCGGECYVLGATVLNQKPSEVAARCEIRSLPDLFNYAEEKDVQGIKDLRPYIPYNATTSKVEFDPTVTEYLYDAAYPDSSCSSDIAAVRVRPIYRTCTATLDGLDLYRIDVINSTAIVPKVCNDKDCTDCLKAEAKDERLALFNLSSTCQPRVDATTSSPLWFKSEIRTIAPASGTKPGGGGSSDGMKVDAGVMRSIVALVGVVIGLMSA